jgi:hypothetical protein
MSLLHVLAACPCPSACPCCLSMLHIHAAYPCFVSMLYKQAAWTCRKGHGQWHGHGIRHGHGPPNDKEGHKQSTHRHGLRNVVRMCIVTPFCGNYDLSHTYELRNHSKPIRLGAVDIVGLRVDVACWAISCDCMIFRIIFLCGFFLFWLQCMLLFDLKRMYSHQKYSSSTHIFPGVAERLRV